MRIASFELHRGAPQVAAARHDVHGAADRTGAPHRGAGPREDLDPLDRGDGDVDVEREVAALRVVDGLSIHEDERPAPARAADRDVGLRGGRATRAHVHAEDGAQDVGQRVRAGQRVDLRTGHDPDDGGSGRVEAGRDGGYDAGDLRRLVLLGSFLRRAGRAEGEAEDGDRGERRRPHAPEDSECRRPGSCG